MRAFYLPASPPQTHPPLPQAQSNSPRVAGPAAGRPPPQPAWTRTRSAACPPAPRSFRCAPSALHRPEDMPTTQIHVRRGEETRVLLWLNALPDDVARSEHLEERACESAKPAVQGNHPFDSVRVVTDELQKRRAWTLLHHIHCGTEKKNLSSYVWCSYVTAGGALRPSLQLTAYKRLPRDKYVYIFVRLIVSLGCCNTKWSTRSSVLRWFTFSVSNSLVLKVDPQHNDNGSSLFWSQNTVL